jgi:hypothetical protein
MNIINDEHSEDERAEIYIRRPERTAGPRYINVEPVRRPPDRIHVDVPPAHQRPRVPSYTVSPEEDGIDFEDERHEAYNRRGYWARRRTRPANNDGPGLIYIRKRGVSDEARTHLESHSDEDGGYHTNTRRPGREAIPTPTNYRETTARLYEGSMRENAWRRKRMEQLRTDTAQIILPEREPPPGAR